MRRFSSYGPLDLDENFGIDRTSVIQRVADQLVGNPNKGGHFFTLFAPRQAGKTTTIREALKVIRAQHGDRFLAGWDILHIVKDLRASLHRILLDAIKIQVEPFPTWEAVHAFFRRGGPLKQPVILILDEFDALPKEALNEAITFFRQVYHRRDEYMLHGVALIGVHAVIGSLEGTVSPFNIQRSVHIPNLTQEEVVALFGQYQQESGQTIEPEVVEKIFDLFRGQPGLTCWFGELLTEKCNPAKPSPYDAKSPPELGYAPLTFRDFEEAQEHALHLEINNNVRNLLSKAREHREFISQLFYRHDLPFELYQEPTQWLYLNGIITGEKGADTGSARVCVFASPFVQKCLFSAFSSGLVAAYEKVELLTVPEKLALHEATLAMDLAFLLEAYRQFLRRQVKKGEAPWEDQPTRSDARAYEAIGHFNLYTWLSLVLRRRMAVIPEFRTRNGTADLLLLHRETRVRTVVEIKSYGSVEGHREGLEQVARYAQRLELTSGWLVVLTDESSWRTLQKEPRVYTREGVTITVEPVPWGWVPEASAPALRTPESSSAAPAPLPAKAGSVRRSRSRSRSVAPPELELEDRLALDALVLPLLTPETVVRMWGTLGFSLSDMPQKEPLWVWMELLNRCMAQGRLEKVFVLLSVMFPSLSAEPLVVRLKSGMSQP